MPLSRVPRVAFFPDSFDEVNGVAHTARQFTAWAARNGHPFLSIHGSTRTQATRQGSLEILALRRSFASIALDKDLRYDLLFARHGLTILRALKAFRPDILHITGPSELGMIGAACAHLLGVPLAASWHTNVHEYAGRRSGKTLHTFTGHRARAASAAVAARVERSSFVAAALFYRSARVVFAPNPGLCLQLGAATGRPCHLMTRGIDAQLYTPARRTALSPTESGTWTLGYVGRLSVEKNVALLPRIAEELRARGLRNVRFHIIGQGVEEAALRAALPEACFPGVLRGEALAIAYSNMDCFLFPSHTDTFGNVVLEAMASGVPAIVTPDGGPAHIVESSDGGGLVATDRDFAAAVASLIENPAAHERMRVAARAWAVQASWDRVF